jgi:hypothetical protein
MISVSILRAAGLTDAQIVKVIETDQKERQAARREQNRIHQRSHRARKHVSAYRADIADTEMHVALPKDVPDRFEEFWKVYPKRGGASNPKKPARDKFERAVKAGADPDAISAAARRYHEIERAAGRAGTDKIAQAVTWLNQQRWNDYPQTVADVPVVLTHGAAYQDGVYVMADTPEWEAWCRFLRQQGKTTPPTSKSGGWRFDTLWPPVPSTVGARA